MPVRHCPKTDLLKAECAHCNGLGPASHRQHDDTPGDPRRSRSRCRSCDAHILWATTDNGRNIPLDPDPDDAGNIQLIDGRAVVLGPLEATLAHDADDDLYVTHFTSCPHADGWRTS